MNTDDRNTGTSGAGHSVPPGAGFMNVVRWVLFAALVVLAVGSIARYAMSRRAAGGGAATSSAMLYRCPMHPSFTSPRKDDECPICGMRLEPVPVNETAGRGASDVRGLVEVAITPERIQMIGVRTVVVGSAELGSGTQLVGFVTPDESRLHKVQLRVAGWIQKLYASRTGDVVRAGAPLLMLYSPELYQSEREYLIELDAAAPHDPAMHADEHADHEAGASAAGRQRLLLMGVPEDEVRRLERERTAAKVLTIRSSVSGTVLERNAVEGQYVGADTPILSVAELSRVWVLADVYERDLARVHVGDPVHFRADGLPSREFEGRIEFVYPTVSSDTRTLKARVALDNRDGMLKPGMFGRIITQEHGDTRLSVPSEAVVRTGEQDYVFLARSGGRFEPRLVHLGESDGERIEILRGVAAGDTIVSSASFLIDSESRLKAAIEGLGAAPGAAAGATPPAGDAATHTGHGR